MGIDKLVKPYRKLCRKIGIPPKFCLIHIGKCGGTSLKKALKVSRRFPGIETVHIQKPVFSSKTRYIIVARDPISRCVSAFNWRYQKVIIRKTELNRFPGEAQVLEKYSTLSNLAEKLYFFDRWGFVY